MTKTLLGAVGACVFGQSVYCADESAVADKLSQDRAAILGMAGAFEVDFSFAEVVPLKKDYELKKAYHETAKELVKVIKDDGKEIILQHLLVVGSKEKPSIIKHWGQVWRYEDTRVLAFQKPRHWKAGRVSADDAKGKWSQLVTQTDDSPRYESLGTWTHDGGVSEWVSDQTRRPLPRREYSKRSDYEVLVGENRHVVTKEGWAHGQWNRKRAERDEAVVDLCMENGLNTYTRIDDEALASAENWWAENHVFWDAVREAWQVLLDEHDSVALAQEANGLSMRKAIRKLEGSADVTKESALTALRPFFAKERKKESATEVTRAR